MVFIVKIMIRSTEKDKVYLLMSCPYQYFNFHIFSQSYMSP